MKSALPSHFRHVAGNVKMHGKKRRVLSCRCCDVVDFRESYFTKLVNKGLELARKTW